MIIQYKEDSRMEVTDLRNGHKGYLIMTDNGRFIRWKCGYVEKYVPRRYYRLK